MNILHWIPSSFSSFSSSKKKRIQLENEEEEDENGKEMFIFSQNKILQKDFVGQEKRKKNKNKRMEE